MEDVYDILIISFSLGLISDEELLLLTENLTNNSGYKQADFPYTDYEQFDRKNFDDLTCKIEFRFEKQHIPRLQGALEIPEEIHVPKAKLCSGLEALCIVLKRFAYPVRYCDMVPFFGRSVTDLCRITLYMIGYIYERHLFRLQSWNQPFLSSECLSTYADVIHAKGAPLTTCFGFIDGTLRPISRPGVNQRMVYNGHKYLTIISMYNDNGHVHADFIDVALSLCFRRKNA